MSLEALDRAAVPAPVLDVVSALHGHRHQAFLVGGCVRDMVRGQAPKDYDVATSATPEEVTRHFKKVIPTGIQHGTVTVISRGVHVEVTTFRVEGAYADGRRPEAVEFKLDVREDLSRRDFTVNAMAYDPIRRQMVDPFGGQQDLAARVIRAVGDPLARFSEDGLRCLRAARFAATLDFQVEPATLAAIAPCLPVFRKVARERVREELTKLLGSEHPDTGLRILAGTGLRAEIVPELGARPVPELGRSPRVLEVRLAALLHDLPPEAAEQALRRLTYPNKAIDHVVQLLRHPAALQGTDEAVRRWAAAIGRELVANAISVAEVVSGTSAAGLHARVDPVLASNPPLRARDLALNGGRIMEVLGVGPSPLVGEATRHLLDRVLAHPEFNTLEGLERLLHDWLKGPRP